MALNNVPLAGQNLVQTRDAINQNFITYIDAQFAVDHVAFATLGAGKHNKVTLPLVSTSPASPVFAAGENGIYNLNNATTTKNEIYLHIQQNATTVEIPMTASTLSSSTPTGLTQGYTFLPSGLILAWGSQLILNAGTTTVNIPYTFSNANRILHVMISPAGLASGGAVTGQVSFIAVTSVNTFTASAQGPSNVVGKFLVIGY